jgi:uncharacterized Zn finger protein (UPF0148 family)
MYSQCPKCGCREFKLKELTIICDNCGSIIEVDLVSDPNDSLLERFEIITGAEKGSFIPIQRYSFPFHEN